MSLAEEAAVVIDLVALVVRNIRRFNEGKITMHMDFRKVWELLATKVSKEIQLAGYGGSIISKIIELALFRAKGGFKPRRKENP